MKKLPSYADIPALPPLALFGGRIALGEVTLLVAPAKTGKSNASASLLSIVSSGDPFPGETERREPRNCLLVSHEDSPTTSTAWKLRANGAELGRVFDISTDENGTPFNLPRHMDLLREAIDSSDAQLVMLDNWGAITQASPTVKVARGIVSPLQIMARETGAAIVILHHTTVSGTTAGGHGLIDAVRCELRLSRDPLNAADRVLSVARTNLSGNIDDIRFTFAGEGVATRVQWLTRADMERRANAWRRQYGATWRAIYKPSGGQPQMLCDWVTRDIARQACQLDKRWAGIPWKAVDAGDLAKAADGSEFAVVENQDKEMAA